MEKMEDYSRSKHTDPTSYFKQSADEYRARFLALEKEHLTMQHNHRLKLQEQKAQLTMQYENRIKQVENDTRSRVLEANTLVAKQEAEVSDEKARRLEIQSQVTELEAINARHIVENRELRDRNKFLQD